MPSTDQIFCFLLSALVHLLAFLLVGSQAGRAKPPPETEPELQLSSVELTLDGAETDAPAAAPADPAPPPLEMPDVREAPPPLLPDKPSFAQELPPPEPAPEPAPAPTPPPPSRPAAAAQPTPPAPAQAPAERTGGAPEQAEIRPATGGAYGQIDAHPSLNRPIKPNYPIGARRRGEEGTVILDVTVATDGSAKAVALVSGSGSAELDRAAERAAAQARFKPGSRNGEPVESSARITIIFRLRDA